MNLKYSLQITHEYIGKAFQKKIADFELTMLNCIIFFLNFTVVIRQVFVTLNVKFNPQEAGNFVIYLPKNA